MVAAWPLAKGLTPWVATPLLGLVGCYGLLVITGTPVRHVPYRLAGLAELFGYQRPVDDDYDGRLRRGRGRGRPSCRAGRAAATSAAARSS